MIALKKISRILALIASACIIAAVPAQAATWVTQLTGNGGTVTCTAEITNNTDQSIPYLYKYSYTLDLTSWTPAVMQGVSIGNPNRLYYDFAGNTKPGYFADNPVYSSAVTSIQWNSTTSYPKSQGQITFYYYSNYGYTQGYITVSGVGKISTGNTYVMVIPEPATISMLGAGLCGIFLRRFRRK